MILMEGEGCGSPTYGQLLDCIQAVRELHVSSGPNAETYGRWPYCKHCSQGPGISGESGSGHVPWPCPTIRALSADPTEEAL